MAGTVEDGEREVLDGGPPGVADLPEGMGIAPSTVSHHLKELRRTGLISMERRGRTVDCTVNLGAVAEMTRLLGTEGAMLTQLQD